MYPPSRRGGERKFSGQDDPVAIRRRRQELSKQGLALAARIDICSVNEISARVQIAVEDTARFRLIGTPAEIIAKRHCAQA